MDKLRKIFGQKPKIAAQYFKQIENILISHDFTPNLARTLCINLENEYNKNTKLTITDLQIKLNAHICNILEKREILLLDDILLPKTIFFFAGVNGSGKTSTIIKFCNLLKERNKEFHIIGGDTFRSGATEQLKNMCDLHNFPIFTALPKEKSSTVVYRALDILTKNEKLEHIIIDTSGFSIDRENLKEEMKKVISLNKKFPTWQASVIIIIDSNMGQPAINQIETFKEIFHNEIDIKGIIFTKVDNVGEAGIIVSVAEKFDVNILFLTGGKHITDIKTYDPNNIYYITLPTIN